MNRALCITRKAWRWEKETGKQRKILLSLSEGYGWMRERVVKHKVVIKKGWAKLS